MHLVLYVLEQEASFSLNLARKFSTGGGGIPESISWFSVGVEVNTCVAPHQNLEAVEDIEPFDVCDVESVVFLRSL